MLRRINRRPRGAVGDVKEPEERYDFEDSNLGKLPLYSVIEVGVHLKGVAGCFG